MTELQGWNSYLPLLEAALNNTTGNVLEMGMGDGSTRLMHDYCVPRKRLLVSLESNKIWFNKFKELECPWHILEHIEDWNKVKIDEPYKWDVALIDHAPGERRIEDIKRLANNCKILIIHDSQPEATGYKLNEIWPLFKYRCDYKVFGDWATAVSNSIDITNLI